MDDSAPLLTSAACHAALAELDALEINIKERRAQIKATLAECIREENATTGLAEAALAVMLSRPWLGDLRSWLAAASACRLARHASLAPGTLEIRAADDEPFVVEAVLGKRGAVWSRHAARFDWLPWRAAVEASAVFRRVTVNRVEVTLPQEARHLEGEVPANLDFATMRVHGELIRFFSYYSGAEFSPGLEMMVPVVRGRDVQIVNNIHASIALQLASTRLREAASITFDCIVLSDEDTGRQLAEIAAAKQVIVVNCSVTLGEFDRRLFHSAAQDLFKSAEVKFRSRCPICCV